MTRRAGSICLLVLALALSACGGGAGQESTRPSPSASPEPTPTASPPDIAGEFAAQMRATTQLDATLSGTLEVGDRAGELSGTLETSGEDLHTLIVVTFPELAPRETETIQIGNSSYELAQDVWIRTMVEPGSGGGSGFQGIIDAALANPDRLVPAGTFEIAGDLLNRLEIDPAPDITADMLGFTDPSVSGFEAAMAFLAEDDGTPAGMVIEATWLQGDDETPATMDLRYRFDWPATDVAIEVPDDPFEWHEGTEFGYRMVKPVNWTVRHEPAEDGFPEMDLYLGTVEEEVQVVRQTDLGGAPSEADWWRVSAQALARDFGVEPEFVSDVTLANGLQARVFVLLFEDADGQSFFFQQAVVYGGAVAWDINWFSLAGSEEADGLQFFKLVRTFTTAD